MTNIGHEGRCREALLNAKNTTQMLANCPQNAAQLPMKSTQYIEGRVVLMLTPFSALKVPLKDSLNLSFCLSDSSLSNLTWLTNTFPSSSQEPLLIFSRMPKSAIYE